ncbi:MAG: alpha/beta fold hydrolase BchO [Pseudomonadota bacterium]
MPKDGAGLDWEEERAAWPMADLARRVEAADRRWHVVQSSDGPDVLLLHGAGGSAHSFRALLPLLEDVARVTVPDLPGHGFTPLPAPHRMTLPHMAEDVALLLHSLSAAPKVVVGHSAGGAIALRLALSGLITPDRIVIINGALTPFRGVAGLLFPTMARMLALNPFAPWILSRTGQDPAAIRRLMAEIGSPLDATGMALYARLAASPGHIAGTLAMMARWDLDPLLSDLAHLQVPVDLVIGDRDGAVPPAETLRIAPRLPRHEIHRFADHGHLLHEEAPEPVAALIRRALGIGL